MLTRSQYQSLLSNPNVQRALNTLSTAEGTAKYANPYATGFGGVQIGDLSKHPATMTNYTDNSGQRTKTSAAGRYQFTAGTYNEIANKLGLQDFSPENQDIAALAAIDQAGALGDVMNANVQGFVDKTGSTWASLPSSPYSQPKVSAATINNAWSAPLATTATPTADTYSPDVASMMSFADQMAPKASFVGPFDAALNTAPPSDQVVGSPLSQMKSDLQAQAAAMANGTITGTPQTSLGAWQQGLYDQAATYGYDPTSTAITGATVAPGTFDNARFGFDMNRFGPLPATTVATPQTTAPTTAAAYADPQVSAVNNPAQQAIAQTQPAASTGNLGSLLGGVTAQDMANAQTDSAHLSSLLGQDASNKKIGGLLGLAAGGVLGGPLGALLGLVAGRQLTPSKAANFHPTAPTAPTSAPAGFHAGDTGNYGRSGQSAYGNSVAGSSAQYGGAVDRGEAGLY